MKIIFISISLFITSVFAQENRVLSKTEYLSAMRTTVPDHTCQDGHPFANFYKGTDCIAEIQRTFDICVTQKDHIDFPEEINTLNAVNEIAGEIQLCAANYSLGGKYLSNYLKKMKKRR